MPEHYTNQHYVPEWYQKRFLAPGATQNELHVLALHPRSMTDPSGRRRPLPQQRRRPIRRCFAEEDLYTLRFGEAVSRHIESAFFGRIDTSGARAVGWWDSDSLQQLYDRALRDLVEFMTAQKLRTPKGLDWLTAQLRNPAPNEVLRAMVDLRTIYTTVWTECVWQIADAADSPTKFIVTDHPVTVYNRAFGPRHARCRGANDPDIRLHGSHTVYPLSRERCLILTNLSWALDPYQRATEMRPNPDFYRDTYFNFLDVQRGRRLAEDEVRIINFILKSRAYRHIAAGEPEWLYPEEFVSKSDWADFGDGYLLMPDPRELNEGVEVIMGYDDGTTEAFDAYGRRPWEPGYEGAVGSARQRPGRHKKFKEEFARLYGPDLRSRAWKTGRDWPDADQGGKTSGPD
ncbi:MAG TPA: DUF4238 domain-containing protein [Iamia sp.]|nr:DUF4238 domain-containing protein [Iamia sp.]